MTRRAWFFLAAAAFVILTAILLIVSSLSGEEKQDNPGPDTSSEQVPDYLKEYTIDPTNKPPEIAGEPTIGNDGTYTVPPAEFTTPPVNPNLSFSDEEMMGVFNGFMIEYLRFTDPQDWANRMSPFTTDSLRDNFLKGGHDTDNGGRVVSTDIAVTGVPGHKLVLAVTDNGRVISVDMGYENSAWKVHGISAFTAAGDPGQ